MRSQTRLYFWLHVPGLSNASRKWSPSAASFTQRAANCSASARYSCGHCPLASRRGELRERAEGHDGLGREVDVVGEVAGEVVGAELVLGVEALGLEVLGPSGEHRPVAAGEVRVALHPRDRGHQDEHVAGLLDRHLVLFGLLAAAVDLAVGVRDRCRGRAARRGTSSAASWRSRGSTRAAPWPATGRTAGTAAPSGRSRPPWRCSRC